jgi:hypothetical protein
MDPPAYQSNPIVSNMRLRFIAASSVPDVAITTDSLLTAAASVCTVASTTCTSVFMACRVKSVEMWATPESTSAGVGVAIHWDQSRMPGFSKSDLSVNVARPAHVYSKPPRDSLAGFWTNAGTNTSMFSLDCPQTAIVDVVLDLVISDGDTISSQATRTVTAGALGKVYSLYLDPGNVYFRPVDRAYVA